MGKSENAREQNETRSENGVDEKRSESHVERAYALKRQIARGGGVPLQEGALRRIAQQ